MILRCLALKHQSINDEWFKLNQLQSDTEDTDTDLQEAMDHTLDTMMLYFHEDRDVLQR